MGATRRDDALVHPVFAPHALTMEEPGTGMRTRMSGVSANSPWRLSLQMLLWAGNGIAVAGLCLNLATAILSMSSYWRLALQLHPAFFALYACAPWVAFVSGVCALWYCRTSGLPWRRSALDFYLPLSFLILPPLFVR